MLYCLFAFYIYTETWNSGNRKGQDAWVGSNFISGRVLFDTFLTCWVRKPNNCGTLLKKEPVGSDLNSFKGATSEHLSQKRSQVIITVPWSCWLCVCLRMHVCSSPVYFPFTLWNHEDLVSGDVGSSPFAVSWSCYPTAWAVAHKNLSFLTYKIGIKVHLVQHYWRGQIKLDRRN